MNYEQAINHIHGMSGRGSKLGLTRITELLNLMGNPHHNLKFIHIAGTNGKGSTAAMTSSILTAAGYNVGMYISPFINRFNERIQLNNRPISDEDLAELTGYVRDYAESMIPDLPTEFEVITAVGFEYFKRKGCDIVVLEVGLGGEFDSTNVIGTPELAIITPIGLDHTRILGDTIEQIAYAKAGIIKQNTDVVVHGQNEPAIKVFKAKCDNTSSNLHVVDFTTLIDTAYNLDYQTFSFGRFKDVQLGLIGAYQSHNAAVVLTAIDVLITKGYYITDESIYKGMHNVKWPARFEVLSKEPVMIVDGGHNPHGVRGTCASISRYFGEERIPILMGVMADKDVSGILDIIIPHASVIYTVHPDNPRSMSCDGLADLIISKGGKSISCGTVSQGIDRLMHDIGTSGKACALGSLYLAGEVRQYYLSKLNGGKNGSDS